MTVVLSYVSKSISIIYSQKIRVYFERFLKKDMDAVYMEHNIRYKLKEYIIIKIPTKSIRSVSFLDSSCAVSEQSSLEMLKFLLGAALQITVYEEELQVFLR